MRKLLVILIVLLFPLMVWAADIDCDGDSNDLMDVSCGGTNVGSLTDGGILLGSGTSAVTALGAAANGEIPIGDGTTDPVLANITETGDALVVTNGAGTIALSAHANVEQIADGTITTNLVNTANPWADNEVVDTLSLAAWNLNKLTSAPGTPVAGEVYYADQTTWDPSGLGAVGAYYCIYDGANYIALFDEDGTWYVSGIETPTLEASQLNDTTDPHLLIVAELKNKILSNQESAGADEWDFPARAEGWYFEFIIEAAQNVTLDPNGTEQWYLNGTQMAAGEAIVNAAPTVGESIVCRSTETAVYCDSKYSDFAEETP